ncbi:MAG: hypothetical protein ACXW3Z_11355 [Limisphaerales bacterium]
MNRESELLKEWKLDATAPSNFNSVVWRRIEARRSVNVAEVISHWMSELFAKRAVAFAYLSVAVVFGLTAAHFQSSNVLRERETQMETRYIQSVDPYALRGAR